MQGLYNPGLLADAGIAGGGGFCANVAACRVMN